MTNKNVLIPVGALEGSLIIPPNKIAETFRKVFNNGLTCGKILPNDEYLNKYRHKYFKDVLKEVITSFDENESGKYKAGGVKIKKSKC